MAERITTTLTREQAGKVFADNCILFVNTNAVPEHRIIELFGVGAGEFIEHCTAHREAFNYNKWGEDDTARVFYESAFRRIVTWHNMELIKEEAMASDAYRAMCDIRQAQADHLAAAEAEGKRKRRATRAAKKAAEQAAQ